MSVVALAPDSIRQDPFLGFVLDYLRELEAQGGEIAATAANARGLAGVWAMTVEAGHGVVVVKIGDDGLPLGFSGAYSTGLEARGGGQLWSATGTYVVSSERGKGHGGELRRAAMRAAKKLGAAAATTGRAPGQAEPLDERMRPVQTLYLMRL